MKKKLISAGVCAMLVAGLVSGQTFLAVPAAVQAADATTGASAEAEATPAPKAAAPKATAKPAAKATATPAPTPTPTPKPVVNPFNVGYQGASGTVQTTNIDGSNYSKLRDIASFLGLGVYFDASTSTGYFLKDGKYVGTTGTAAGVSFTVRNGKIYDAAYDGGDASAADTYAAWCADFQANGACTLKDTTDAYAAFKAAVTKAVVNGLYYAPGNYAAQTNVYDHGYIYKLSFTINDAGQFTNVFFDGVSPEGVLKTSDESGYDVNYFKGVGKHIKDQYAAIAANLTNETNTNKSKADVVTGATHSWGAFNDLVDAALAQGPIVPAEAAAPAAPAADTLTTLDFGTTLANFEDGSQTTADWNRSNVVTADVTTTATIEAPHGETNPVIMIKGDSGTMTAESTDSGTLAFDPAVNSQYGSVLMMKDGQTAQVGDGIFKFSMRVSNPLDGVWNNQVAFRLSTPNAQLTDAGVTALAIQTANGGNIQLVQADGSKVNVIKDTGVNINDKTYHYFAIAMQDVATGTNVKLWVDGAVVYSGVVTGLEKTGAIQIYNNSTPQYDADGNPLVTTGTSEGSFAAVTACGESYIGGYNDGPAIADLTLDAVQ